VKSLVNLQPKLEVNVREAQCLAAVDLVDGVVLVTNFEEQEVFLLFGMDIEGTHVKFSAVALKQNV
jgi:hypothetical protein